MPKGRPFEKGNDPRRAAGFQKGQAANPGGRAKGLGAIMRELARNGVNTAKVLREILEKGEDRDRLAAAKEIHDRGWGRAVQMTALTEEMLDVFMTGRVDDMRAEIAALVETLTGTAQPEVVDAAVERIGQRWAARAPEIDGGLG